MLAARGARVSLRSGAARLARPPSSVRRNGDSSVRRHGDVALAAVGILDGQVEDIGLGELGFLSDALQRLAEEEPLASVAVLTADAELSAVYYQGLVASDVPRVRRVVNQEFTFAPGIEVTEIEQVKGLEFDYVIVVDVTDHHYPDSARARRKLHVAATRAIHQLWLTCVGPPSTLIGAVGR